MKLMEKIILFLFFAICGLWTAHAQTLHTIIFANKEEPNRGADRTAEFNNMASFCSEIANGLGYRHDLHCHSGKEFTSITAEREISNLQVSDGDIVIFYYDGHGCNWDDDAWPHMAFLDKQYWETTCYNKLKAACKNAKLTLLIAGCCNMDTEGQRRGRNRQYSAMDRTKLRTLFVGFPGKISIKSSASRRGQYSYSITGGSTMGNVYAMNVRDAIRDATMASANKSLTWDAVMDEAAQGSYNDTKGFEAGPQQPQHEIEKFKESPQQIPTSPSMRSTPIPTKPSTGAIANAKFKRVSATGMKLKDGGYVTILASFETNNMNEQGGRMVAFINDKEVRNIDFGTHYSHNTFSNKVVMIPADKVLSMANNGEAKIRVGIYDYKQKKYIAYSDYINLNVR